MPLAPVDRTAPVDGGGLAGVTSAMVRRYEGWVRMLAQALVRHLPANVERADLVQAGLIAVAHCLIAFDGRGGQDAFEAFARKRVRGAMLDELRRMDFLDHRDRRKVKAVEAASRRLRSGGAFEPTLRQLAEATGFEIEEIGVLQAAEQLGRHHVNVDDEDDSARRSEPPTDPDWVEQTVHRARMVDRFDQFRTRLPERERQTMDAYLGLGPSPTEVAQAWAVSPSRLCQLFARTLRQLSVVCGSEPVRPPPAPPAPPERSAPRHMSFPPQRPSTSVPPELFASDIVAGCTPAIFID